MLAILHIMTLDSRLGTKSNCVKILSTNFFQGVRVGSGVLNPVMAYKKYIYTKQGSHQTTSAFRMS